MSVQQTDSGTTNISNVGELCTKIDVIEARRGALRCRKALDGSIVNNLLPGRASQPHRNGQSKRPLSVRHRPRAISLLGPARRVVWITNESNPLVRARRLDLNLCDATGSVCVYRREGKVVGPAAVSQPEVDVARLGTGHAFVAIRNHAVREAALALQPAHGYVGEVEVDAVGWEGAAVLEVDFTAMISTRAACGLPLLDSEMDTNGTMKLEYSQHHLELALHGQLSTISTTTGFVYPASETA